MEKKKITVTLFSKNGEKMQIQNKKIILHVLKFTFYQSFRQYNDTGYCLKIVEKDIIHAIKMSFWIR